eukprot:2505377-Rhodomonas_salina.1
MTLSLPRPLARSRSPPWSQMTLNVHAGMLTSKSGSMEDSDYFMDDDVSCTSVSFPFPIFKEMKREGKMREGGRKEEMWTSDAPL